MSRHELEPFDRRHKIIVGWDHPMMTFFVQVIDRAAEDAGDDDKFVLWQGTDIREIYEIEQLVRIVRPYGDIGADLRGVLYGDRDEGR